MKVLITGTSSGGKGIADKFLREGHHVTGIDCNKSAIQHTAYRHICMDIRDKMHYPELGPFDIVINNAGVQNNNDIDVNLKGTIDITEKYGIHPVICAVLYDRIGQWTQRVRISGICSKQRRGPLHKEHCSPYRKIWCNMQQS